jgi:ectoine hydroxylase-related dioxygenase (phytanoyl-CoA dioxygenase family)
MTVTLTTPGVFDLDQIEELAEFTRAYGFSLLRGAYTDDDMASIDAAIDALITRADAGHLPEQCGTTVLTDDARAEHARTSYICHVTEVSDALRAATLHPALVAVARAVLGDEAWLLEDERFGVVYQDARPGAESAYSRIGWHSDWQSGAHLSMWPSLAFTIHQDATSPANGFLRVVPGSHLWATPAPSADINGRAAPAGGSRSGGHGSEPPPMPMPLGFSKVPGEIAVYAERGDVIFHDAYLWHSAARATEDAPGGLRRHLRGGWYAGERLARGHGLDDFVKNAAR